MAICRATSYYTLPSTDYAKMTSNYIPNYKQLGLLKDHTLGFILYGISIPDAIPNSIQLSISNLNQQSVLLQNAKIEIGRPKSCRYRRV